MSNRSEQLETLLTRLSETSAWPVDRDLITRAFNFALEAHKDQKRKSGEPYFNHLYETALIAAKWQVDSVTIAAALLHDVLEDTSVTEAELSKEFGKDIAFLVNGVTKISRLKYRGNQAQAETLKKMILALSQDIRVVFIKLADRTHNMSTLEHLAPDKQKRIALETTEIYAPLAYRMGLGTVSGDLEDAAFPYLHPEVYKSLQETLKDHLAKGEEYIKKVEKEVTEALANQKIKIVRIDHRVKRISSLYKKLRRYDMNLERIHDLIALRIIVEKVEDCYAVLGVIHSIWPPMPGHIKDYIALPKPNGYRSLHTTVISSNGQPTEFQIRTEEMHYENEYGIAAYWAYQEAKGGQKYLEEQSHARSVLANARQTAWITQLQNWQHDIEDPDEFIAALKIDLFKDRIFVITPKGEAVDLPAGATPLDFAYAIHSDIGNHCVGAKVNSRMVQLDTELQSGDIVEILVQKNRKPNLAWLGFLKTRHARAKLRSSLRENSMLPTTNYYFSITGLDRTAMMRDITAAVSQQGLGIVSLEAPKNTTHAVVTIKLYVHIESISKADQLALRLRAIPSVQRVEYKR